MKQLRILLLASMITLFTTYANASVNMAPIISYLLSDSTDSLSGLDIIKAYADDEGNPAPTVQDYEDAGVVGVTLENIDDVNGVIAGLTSIDVDTTEKVQTIVDDVNSNTPPIANAGIDQQIVGGTSTTLDGSLSEDADDDPLTYSWSFVDEPSEYTGMVNTDTVNPTFGSLDLGEFDIQLIVNDGIVDSAPDIVTVTVIRPNTVPVADAGVGQYVDSLLSTDVYLSGFRSSDEEEDPLSYAWSIITKPTGSSATLSDATLMNPILLTADVDGFYEIQLIVNDGIADSAPDTVKIAVGASSEITHNGISYKTVVSPFTGKTWLDRNLGANQVCTSYIDTACYGDYYQWGRNTDGHQRSNSGTTGIQATDINNAGAAFILSSDWAAIDEDADASLRLANWSSTDGTSVCPADYRVPTSTEISSETIAVGVAGLEDSFNNFLRIPSGGDRDYYDGSLDLQTYGARLWTTTLDGSSRAYMFFAYTGSDPGAWVGASIDLGDGVSVRCLKD